jgi:hypothetical protein
MESTVYRGPRRIGGNDDPALGPSLRYAATIDGTTTCFFKVDWNSVSYVHVAFRVNNTWFEETIVSCRARIVQELSRAAGSSSSSLTIIVAQHSTESLAPSDRVLAFVRNCNRVQQPVSKTLMISLTVVVSHVLCNRAPKGCLTDKDHPIQALFLDGADEALRKRLISGQQLHRVRSLKHPYRLRSRIVFIRRAVKSSRWQCARTIGVKIA